MSLTGPRVIATAALGWLFAAGIAMAAAGSCDPFRVYDDLLSLTPDKADHAGAQEIIVVRYLPGDTSIDHEYKIKLIVSKTGAVHATAIAPNGLSVMEQIRAAEARGITGCQDVERAIDLRRTIVSDSVAKRAIRRFHRISIPIRLESAIYLDAPRYEVYDEAGMNSQTFVLCGPTLQSRHPHPLILWAHSLLSTLK